MKKDKEDRALLETRYLSSSLANAKSLRESIDRMNRGEGIIVDAGIFDGSAKAG